jgi:tRNA(Ile)-lysidine synthase
MKHHPLISTLNTYAQHHNLLPEGSTIILGLSGGPDSMMLLHYLAALHAQGTIKLIAAHLDHEWRDDSHNDVIFCQEAAKSLGVGFVTQKISNLGLSLKFNGSKEEYARKARRSFFEQLRIEHNADYIALAHHADDQQETFFIRLMRGASLTGLTAMRPKHGVYIRPLLAINKHDILTFLHEHTIQYLTDPTNTHDTYLRNRIRNTIIPALKLCDQRFTHNALRTIDQLQKTEDYLSELTQSTFATITTRDEQGNYCIDINTFLAQHTVLQQRLLLYWFIECGVPFAPSQALFDEILRFVNTERGGTHQIHPAWHLIKKQKTIWIQKHL